MTAAATARLRCWCGYPHWMHVQWLSDRLRSWWYWHCTAEGAQRIREARAIADAVALIEPDWWRELERARLERCIERRGGWWDVPTRWTR